MRWLACAPGPAYSVQDCHNGWVEALRNAGEKVLDYPLGDWITFFGAAQIPAGTGVHRPVFTADQAYEAAADRLAAALWKTRPDVLFLTSGFFLPLPLLDTARRDGVKIVLLCTEQPYELSRELELAEHSDIAMLTDPTTLARFTEVCTAVHQPHCYRPTVHHPGPADPTLEADLAFVGTGFPSRVEFFEAMALDGLDVMLAGNWQDLPEESPLRGFVTGGREECLDNTKTAAVYRSMRVGLNLYRREAEAEDLVQGWAVGPREIEMAACGGYFVRDSRPEGDALFPSLPVFRSAEEAGELVRWALAHPQARADAAAKAQEAVQDRTFDNAAARLLRLIEE